MATLVKDKRMAMKIAAYIMKNLDRPLNISSLSNEFRISDFTLKRIFKAAFNQPVHRFILEKRLESAKRLLLETNYPVKEIASLTGLGSSSSFTDAFHKRFGIPPAEFRNGQ